MNEELTKISNDITMLFVRMDEIRSDILKAINKSDEEQTTFSKPAPVEEKKQYQAICHMCESQCTVPFKPHEGAKIKCKQCWLKTKETA